MMSWVDSLMHTFMQVFHYSVKTKTKKTNKQQRTKQNKIKQKMGPGARLTNFNTLSGEFNFQCF